MFGLELGFFFFFFLRFGVLTRHCRYFGAALPMAVVGSHHSLALLYILVWHKLVPGAGSSLRESSPPSAWACPCFSSTPLSLQNPFALAASLSSCLSLLPLKAVPTTGGEQFL